MVMLKISLAALLLAAAFLAALETWLDIHARQAQVEIWRLEDRTPATGRGGSSHP